MLPPRARVLCALSSAPLERGARLPMAPVPFPIPLVTSLYEPALAVSRSSLAGIVITERLCKFKYLSIASGEIEAPNCGARKSTPHRLTGRRASQLTPMPTPIKPSSSPSLAPYATCDHHSEAVGLCDVSPAPSRARRQVYLHRLLSHPSSLSQFE